MDDCFYLPTGDDTWLATWHTAGPWDARFQHGGPPSALLARAIELTEPREELVVARMTVEILGPIPVAELTVRSRVLRPGRSVELVEAVLSADGRDAARAAAWRIRRTASAETSSRTAVSSGTAVSLDLPGQADEKERSGWQGGYLAAVEWRFVQGHFTEPGPAAAWTRLRYPLVPGDEPSPLQRVLAVADSGNGISSTLDLTRWHFINPELTVHLHREAVGEWVCLDASTTISPGGTGLATSVLSDLAGRVGVGAQSLLVAPR